MACAQARRTKPPMKREIRPEGAIHRRGKAVVVVDGRLQPRDAQARRSSRAVVGFIGFGFIKIDVSAVAGDVVTVAVFVARIDRIDAQQSAAGKQNWKDPR